MKKIELPIDEIIRKYEEGIAQYKIAYEYDVSETTIRTRIKEYYKKTDKEKPDLRNKRKKLPIDEIIIKYTEGVSQYKIAKEYDVSEHTIHVMIKEYYEKIGKKRPDLRNKRKKLPIDEIIRKYEEGIAGYKIAKEYDISQSTINLRIKEYYEKIGKGKPDLRNKRKKLPIDEIIRKYEEGISQCKIAKEYGMSHFVIGTRIKEYYKKTGKEKPDPRNKKKELPIDEIIRKYEEGNSQYKIAYEYGVSQSTIELRTRDYYEKTGKERPNQRNKRKELQIDEIIRKYEEGISKKELAEEYDVSEVTIRLRIKEYYKKICKKEPRILKVDTIIIDYLNKGLTIEEIIEIAAKNEVVIPKDIIDKALSKVNNKNFADNKEER